MPEMCDRLKEKIVLITGGTGSFGTGFIQAILKNHNPKTLRIFSRDELKQFEMRQKYDDNRLRFLIGNVRDKERLYRAMHNVDIVIHAAALKQVPSCEYNPFEAVKTNILGTQNVIDAAIDCKVKKAVFISSDKAVNPVNLYGATKLTAEKLFIHGNSYVGVEETKFSCIRYGNVIGSRGSVIPLYIRQKEKGKITITDKRMTRFWITLPQAVAFVVECLCKMHGGEIFIPKIPSMRIEDLAKVIAPKNEIEITGIRPGEKLHEVLISNEEARQTLNFDDMFVVLPVHGEFIRSQYKTGRPLPDDFQYRSDNNPQQLDLDEIQKSIEDLN